MEQGSFISEHSRSSRTINLDDNRDMLSRSAEYNDDDECNYEIQVILNQNLMNDSAALKSIHELVSLQKAQAGHTEESPEIDESEEKTTVESVFTSPHLADILPVELETISDENLAVLHKIVLEETKRRQAAGSRMMSSHATESQHAAPSSHQHAKTQAKMKPHEEVSPKSKTKSKVHGKDSSPRDGWSGGHEGLASSLTSSGENNLRDRHPRSQSGDLTSFQVAAGQNKQTQHHQHHPQHHQKQNQPHQGKQQQNSKPSAAHSSAGPGPVRHSSRGSSGASPAADFGQHRDSKDGRASGSYSSSRHGAAPPSDKMFPSGWADEGSPINLGNYRTHAPAHALKLKKHRPPPSDTSSLTDEGGGCTPKDGDCGSSGSPRDFKASLGTAFDDLSVGSSNSARSNGTGSLSRASSDAGTRSVDALSSISETVNTHSKTSAAVAAVRSGLNYATAVMFTQAPAAGAAANKESPGPRAKF